MDSFMSWIGGKKALRDEILHRFPLEFERYVEVFGGAGWVLFHKPPGPFEVYNDVNGNLVNLFACVRDWPEELIAALEFTLNAREDFDRLRAVLRSKAELPDLTRAAYFYQVLCQSYAKKMTAFAGLPCGMWDRFPLIRAAAARLQGVVVENLDFERLVERYDHPDTFFYLDPPYYFTEGLYRGMGFTRADHERLAATLMRTAGRWLLSYNDCGQVRGLYDWPGVTIETVSRIDNMAQRFEGGKQYGELIIANYDTMERARQHVQLSLFD